MTRVHL